MIAIAGEVGGWSYIAGQIVGRLLASYGLVLAILWVASRFDWRRALRRSRSARAVICVLGLFLLGVAGFALRMTLPEA